jgi:hypothetical protein
MTAKRAAFTAMLGGALLTAGCGGDDAAGKDLKASGGVDPVKAIADQNAAKPVDKNDPNFQKMATPDKQNTARNPGVSSGGATSSAVLD